MGETLHPFIDIRIFHPSDGAKRITSGPAFSTITPALRPHTGNHAPDLCTVVSALRNQQPHTANIAKHIVLLIDLRKWSTKRWRFA